MSANIFRTFETGALFGEMTAPSMDADPDPVVEVGLGSIFHSKGRYSLNI